MKLTRVARITAKDWDTTPSKLVYDQILAAVQTLDEGYEEGQCERAKFFERAHEAGVAARDAGIAYGLCGPSTSEELAR